MARFGMIPRFLALGLLLLLAGARPASAATASIAVGGTATGSGMVDIIIEDAKAPAATIHEIQVPIPAGSDENQTAQLIRDALNEELPPVYEATLGTACVRLDGPFIDIQLTEDVPGQEIFLSPDPCRLLQMSAPDLGPVATLVFASLLAIGALGLLRRRQLV